MSLRSFTIDQLMQLDKPTLEYALRLFQKELDGTLAFLAETPDARTDEHTLDDLSNLLTLLKVVKLRIEELEAERVTEDSPMHLLPSAQQAEPALA